MPGPAMLTPPAPFTSATRQPMRRSVLRASALMLAAVLLGNLHAPAKADTAALGLLDALKLAQQQDPQYRAAQAQAQADAQLPSLGLATLLPQVSASARLEEQTNTYQAFGQNIEAKRNPGTYALVLNQALFRPQAWASYQQSRLMAEQGELRLRSASQNLILRVADAYLAVLAAQDDLRSLAAQEQAVVEQLQFAKKNFEIGNATITDQQEAQARFDLIAAQALAANNALTVAQLGLQTLIGQPADRLQPLSPAFTLAPPMPNDPKAWAEAARQSNLEVLQAQLGLEIARREVDKSRHGHLPTLDFTAQVVDTEQQIFDASTGRPFDIGVDNTTFGLVLNMPIFSGGGTQARVKQQASMLQKSRSELDFSVSQAQQQAQAAYLQLNTSLGQVRALQTAKASSLLALQANRTGYEVGVRSNIDVLNAQQQLSAIERDLSRAQYQSLSALLRLQAVVGQLSAETLTQISVGATRP